VEPHLLLEIGIGVREGKVMARVLRQEAVQTQPNVLHSA